MSLSVSSLEIKLIFFLALDTDDASERPYVPWGVHTCTVLHVSTKQSADNKSHSQYKEKRLSTIVVVGERYQIVTGRNVQNQFYTERGRGQSETRETLHHFSVGAALQKKVKLEKKNREPGRQGERHGSLAKAGVWGHA